MNKGPILQRTNIKSWENFHRIFNQHVAAFYLSQNGNSGQPREDYNTMTRLIQRLIGECIQKKITLRAVGSGWSFTKVATTNGYVLDTTGMNTIFDLTKLDVTSNYADFSSLCFLQCGVKIRDINHHLTAIGRSLKTSGASDGQTIVGALSTGTHGASYDIGAIQDFVVGIHLIVGPNRTIWLERKSQPIVSEEFVKSLETMLVQDDELFNAVLVSFGSFGFIHSILIETEPSYIVQLTRKRIPLAKINDLMTTLDFTRTEDIFPKIEGEYPFHFQVVVNPYNWEEAIVTYAYKTTRAVREAFFDKLIQEAGELIYKLIAVFGSGDPHSLPGILKFILKTFYKDGEQIGALGDIFTQDDTPNNNYSTAMGFSLKDVLAVIAILKENTNDDPQFAGLYSFRYVKSSMGLLAFTNSNEITCVLELDGVQSSMNELFFHNFYSRLRQQNIPFTFHWGKMNDLNPAVLRPMYGDKLLAWERHRREALDSDTLGVFTNELITKWGIQR